MRFSGEFEYLKVRTTNVALDWFRLTRSNAVIFSALPGRRPDPLGELTALQQPPAGFWGDIRTSKGRRGQRRGRETRIGEAIERREERGGEGRERDGERGYPLGFSKVGAYDTVDSRVRETDIFDTRDTASKTDAAQHSSYMYSTDVNEYASRSLSLRADCCQSQL